MKKNSCVVIFLALIFSYCSYWNVEFNKYVLGTVSRNNFDCSILLKIDSLNVKEKYRVSNNTIKWTPEMIDSLGIYEYDKNKKRGLKRFSTVNRININRFEVFVSDSNVATIKGIKEKDSIYEIIFNTKKNGSIQLFAIDKVTNDTCTRPVWIKDGFVYPMNPTNLNIEKHFNNRRKTE